MSKKKAFSGNTMTLKDFHGGTIPSDLPLPSAPGVVVRTSDRSGYDRSASWGNPVGRSDHRPRPNSSPATRHLDDKTPFLTHTARIGRNFDEDERKPLDGLSAPRKMVNDDSFRGLGSRVELKSESASTGRIQGRQGLAPVTSLSSGAGNLHPGRANDAAVVGVIPQDVGVTSGHVVSGAHPNAWAPRKEVIVSVPEPMQSTWSGQIAISKLAHASALEKVSSGRWQSKHSLQYQTDVEVIKHTEPESGICSKNYGAQNRMDVTGGREYSDATLARYVERDLSIEEGFHSGSKDLPDYECPRAPAYSEVKERKYATCTDGFQPPHSDSKFGGLGMQQTGPTEASERPKLKLLPRTKPLENMELPVHDSKQGQLPSNLGSHGGAETDIELHGHVNVPKPGLPGIESVNQAVDRPKLNLKPRSQPLEQLEGNIEAGRNAVFGGARPRELVLKERGINDVAIDNHELGQHSDRVKHDVPKTERVHEHALPSRHGERTENGSLDPRTGRKFEKKDSRGDVERVDAHRRNWRHENWRNSRENERQQQQQERKPSPETWHKPGEQGKPASSDGAGLRYGKAASAVELAQAFSRSFSHPKADDPYSTQRGLPGRTQMPFSRLMSTAAKQINGY